VVVDNIFSIITKGQNSISINNFKNSLFKLGLIFTYEEISSLLNCFFIENGFLREEDFNYIMKSSHISESNLRRPKSVF